MTLLSCVCLGPGWRRAGRPLVCGAVTTLLAVAAVAATGCSARSAPGAPAAIADAQTAVRVKTALVNHESLGTLPIDVRVRSGVVTLDGTVRSADEVESARKLALGVAGVARVESRLQIGDPDQPPATGSLPPGSRNTPPAVAGPSTVPDNVLPVAGNSRLPALAPRPEEGPLRLVGLGASVRVTRPSEATLGGALTVGPLLRLRPRNGLGPAIAFNWTNTEIETGPGGQPALAAIQLRPVMAGLEYGVVRGRLAVGASAVGGYSFNRLDVDTARAGPGRAIAVGNSFVWRPGAVLWADVTRRVGINVFAGYLFTRPRVTFASDASIATERVSASSVVVSAGVAYWIF